MDVVGVRFTWKPNKIGSAAHLDSRRPGGQGRFPHRAGATRRHILQLFQRLQVGEQVSELFGSQIVDDALGHHRWFLFDASLDRRLRDRLRKPIVLSQNDGLGALAHATSPDVACFLTVSVAERPSG